ncbi:MAG: hypothetical protein PHX51_03150 [Clostridia bacterium]|nr:hypothetical protein [Clostridia bacterium]
MNDYDILGVMPNASPQEIDEAYRIKKEQYSNDSFSVGIKGEQAIKKLEELEKAYANVKRHPYSFNGKTSYDEIRDLLTENRINEAQKILDDIDDRNAEWHYLQSVLYYKKSWYVEARKQLEFALKLDPDNAKYKQQLNDLNKIISKKEVKADQYSYSDSGKQNSRDSYTQEGGGLNNGTCTGSCCGDACLANCCCNCCANGCCR